MKTAPGYACLIRLIAPTDQGVRALDPGSDEELVYCIFGEPAGVDERPFIERDLQVRSGESPGGVDQWERGLHVLLRAEREVIIFSEHLQMVSPP